jgi:uncharacterized protein
VPTRSCVACRTSRPKRELIRIVRRPDGSVELDDTGRVAGRGAYLCADGACWTTALAKGALQRALGAPLGEAIRSVLEAGPTTRTNTTTTTATRATANDTTTMTMTGGAIGGEE